MDEAKLPVPAFLSSFASSFLLSVRPSPNRSFVTPAYHYASRSFRSSQPSLPSRPVTVISMGLFDNLRNAVQGATNSARLSSKSNQAAVVARRRAAGVKDGVTALLSDRDMKGLIDGYQKVVLESINVLEQEMEALQQDSQSGDFSQITNNLIDKARMKLKELGLPHADHPQQPSSSLAASSLDSNARLFEDFVASSLLPRAFALVREASFRVLGLRHYDVQLMGGIALHQGRIVQMNTGEGKTLVATTAAYLNAVVAAAKRGRNTGAVMVVTVNDYLARRDASIMGQVYRFLGLSVGLVQATSTTQQRKAAYASDIVYVTNSELGFDYLRDNLALIKDDIVISHPFNFCIIDEADSILIDEARTPLIISSKENAPVVKYENAMKLAQALSKKVHYSVNEKDNTVLLNERGLKDCENALKISDLYNPKDPWASYIQNALKAKELFQKDVHYVVKNKQVQIVDEFTGRVMDGRRWSDGLHQAVEAKELLPVSPETTTIASISYQAFFKLFPKVSGMTGTADTEAEELADIYDIGVVVIPPALPVARKDYPDAVFKNQQGKFNAVMREIARVHPKGQPVLIGTTSIEASETMSQLLDEVGVPHEVLNARPENVTRENEIIAQAGRKYAITIATNMAGRGTDILLGGNPDFFARLALKNKLLKTIIKGYKEEGIAMPCELSEEAQAKLYAAVTEVQKAYSFESKDKTVVDMDEKISMAAEYGPLPADQPSMTTLREAFQAIKTEFSSVLKIEKEEVQSLGGLYVIGTERHESRRIDGQLRGRAGRQGDPGASRFFLALDDKLFQVFGSDKMAGILNAFRVDDDTPIESDMVTKSLNNVQKNVEKQYSDSRKGLFEYDEIMAKQREVFYSQRLAVLKGDAKSTSDLLELYCVETLDDIFPNYVKPTAKEDNFEGLSNKLGQFFAGIQGVSPQELSKISSSQMRDYLVKRTKEAFNAKEGSLSDIKSGFESEVERFLVLTQMDNLWKTHIRDMISLRDVIGLRSYAEINPLDAYQNEGLEMFEEMLVAIRRNTVYSLFQYNPKTDPKAKEGNVTASSSAKKSNKKKK